MVEMSNRFSAYATKRGGAYWAMVRFAKNAKPNPLMGEGGKPLWFPDELSATKAALAHMLAYFNGHLVSSGELNGGSIREARFAAADKHFKTRGDDMYE